MVSDRPAPFVNILLSGATGFLGQYVATALRLAGCHTVVISRKSVPSVRPGSLISVVAHDLASAAVFDPDISSPVHAIVHMAHPMGGSREEQTQVAARGTSSLLEYAATHGIRSFVLLSSLSVLDLATVTAYGQINSQTPRLKPDATLPAYPAAKLAQELLVEQAVARGAVDVLILRPGLIYDDTVMSNAYAGLIKNKLQLRVDHDGEIPLVSAQQVARVVVRALSAPLTPGLAIQTVLDDSPWSMQQYQEALISRGQLKPNAWNVPWQLLDGAGALAYAGAGAFGLAHRLPDLFRQPSRAARLKPHRYWPAINPFF